MSGWSSCISGADFNFASFPSPQVERPEENKVQAPDNSKDTLILSSTKSQPLSPSAIRSPSTDRFSASAPSSQVQNSTILAASPPSFAGSRSFSLVVPRAVPLNQGGTQRSSSFLSFYSYIYLTVYTLRSDYSYFWLLFCKQSHFFFLIVPAAVSPLPSTILAQPSPPLLARPSPSQPSQSRQPLKAGRLQPSVDHAHSTAAAVDMTGQVHQEQPRFNFNLSVSLRYRTDWNQRRIHNTRRVRFPHLNTFICRKVIRISLLNKSNPAVVIQMSVCVIFLILNFFLI